VAEVYARSGRYEDALAAFTQSIALDSSAENRGALIGMAEALQVLDRSDEARVRYRDAIRMEPGDLTVRKRLINHFLYNDELDSAIAAIHELLQIDPDDPERLRLGMIWYGTSDTVRAESLFTAVEKAEGGYLPTFYLGRIAEDRRDFETAKSYYYRVIAESDTIPDGWLHLGSVLLEQDSVTAAVDVLTRALGKCPIRKRFGTSSEPRSRDGNRTTRRSPGSAAPTRSIRMTPVSSSRSPRPWNAPAVSPNRR